MPDDPNNPPTPPNPDPPEKTYTADQVREMLTAKENAMKLEFAEAAKNNPPDPPAPPEPPKEPDPPPFDAQAAIAELSKKVDAVIGTPREGVTPPAAAPYDPTREIGKAFGANVAESEKGKAMDDWFAANRDKTLLELGLVETRQI